MKGGGGETGAGVTWPTGMESGGWEWVSQWGRSTRSGWRKGRRKYPEPERAGAVLRKRRKRGRSGAARRAVAVVAAAVVVKFEGVVGFDKFGAVVWRRRGKGMRTGKRRLCFRQMAGASMRKRRRAAAKRTISSW